MPAPSGLLGCILGLETYVLAMLMLHVYIVPTMLTELIYPLQLGDTLLHLAAEKGRTKCMKRLLFTPGINVNIKNKVSWSIDCYMSDTVMIMLRTV